jgi:2-methylisocitrate lyase-like PEP mutase family enzyme
MIDMTDIGQIFRALHVKGNPFILVNVWDAGSAKMMAAMGAKALATSSAAHAFTLGRADGGTVTLDEALAHAQDICAATPLPVQGDFENGFGDDPDSCAQTVRMAVETGLAGICLEDIQFPSQTAYDFDLAVERMKAAAAAARAANRDFVLTARADGVMMGAYDIDEAIRRIQAFDAVGVDCLYAPMPATMADLGRIIAATDKPVNVLAAGRFAKNTQSEFAALGAARISIGGALARVTHKAIFKAGSAMLSDGDFSGLTQAMSGGDVDAMMI